MTSLDTIKQEFAKHIYLLSYNIIDICLAASVANRLKGPCLCLYVIGPGSTAKTEALHIMSEHPSNYWITDLTEHTLFSGALGGYSLVPQLYARGVRSILMQDFTLILEKRHDQRQEII